MLLIAVAYLLEGSATSRRPWSIASAVTIPDQSSGAASVACLWQEDVIWAQREPLGAVQRPARGAALHPRQLVAHEWSQVPSKLGTTVLPALETWLADSEAFEHQARAAVPGGLVALSAPTSRRLTHGRLSPLSHRRLLPVTPQKRRILPFWSSSLTQGITEH